MFENKAMVIGIAAATGALGNALTFGTYDYFKGKGYGGWTAGALMGGILGLAGGALLAFSKPQTAEIAGCLGGGCSGLAGVTLTQLPKAIGYFTAQDLSGVTVEQLSGTGLRVA